MTTTESNVLIAEFLNVSINENGTFELPEYGTIRPNGDFKTGFNKEQLKYHTDWNWLMNAVDKIESFGYVFQLQGNSATFFKNKTFKEPIWNDSFIGNTKLKATYNAVVEFIKWYNEQ